MVQLLKDGAVTQEYAYDAYGYINADEFGIQAPFYGYNGEEQNPFTGLQYLRARYYAPQNGGFITQDSFSGVLTNALSQNRYAYAHNNPVNYADPSGHSIWDSIKNGVTNAVNSVKNFVSNVANKVSSAVSSAVNAVKSAVTGTTTKTVANTSSAVKKSYTNTAVRQKIGSYAGGAAAAAAQSVTTRYSNSVVNGVIADSRIPFTNAAGQTVMLPNHFSNMQAAAQAFTKKGCDDSLSKYEQQKLQSQQSWWKQLFNSYNNYISQQTALDMQMQQAQAEMFASWGSSLKNALNKYGEFSYQQSMDKIAQDRFNVEAAVVLSMAVGADWFGREKIPTEVSESNREHNAVLDEALAELYNNSQHLNGQGRDIFSDYKMGNSGSFDILACLPFALYNANVSLGEHENLSDIIYGIETNGYVAKNERGTVTSYIPEYFSEKGYDVNISYVPTAEELERMVRENDTVIIYRSNSPNPLGSAHFMNIGYDEKKQEYLIYNQSNDREYPRTIESLADLYGNAFNKPLYVYAISKGA